MDFPLRLINPMILHQFLSHKSNKCYLWKLIPQKQINMTQKFLYKSPEVEIIESLTEGVLCASNADLELDMNPEEGNM